ncbi:hypothetical protein E1180_01720 [Roseibium denhamense]|uniref:Uncharacterized protein n=1 Tax=Roseibium denhamense TaxID=76305 RepID=A0ABY1PN16_9HYPH|nr:hypothetical protein [Roseibium denhamense]MTI04234.1 hypothetical protein [Roseibium denhamense]SMP37377.1 hypothetical protein SAMN06265374_0085 [Roseibium denhamense]
MPALDYATVLEAVEDTVDEIDGDMLILLLGGPQRVAATIVQTARNHASLSLRQVREVVLTAFAALIAVAEELGDLLISIFDKIARLTEIAFDVAEDVAERGLEMGIAVATKGVNVGRKLSGKAGRLAVAGVKKAKTMVRKTARTPSRLGRRFGF